MTSGLTIPAGDDEKKMPFKKHLAMPMASQALTLFRLLVAGGKSEFDATAVVSLYPKAH